MIIGEFSVIPENIQRGCMEWLASIPTYRVSMVMHDGTTLEQFVPAEKDASKLLALIDKAITAAAPVRDALRTAMIKEGEYDDDE